MDPNLQVSRDAARALEEFSDEFRSALELAADIPLWAAEAGLVRTTNALKTTFPVPISAAGYHERKGDDKYRSLYSRSFSMTTKDWQDGVEENSDVIEAPDFIDWSGEPARIATEWQRLPNVIVADMLALNTLAGPVCHIYDDPDTGTAGTRKLFAGDHPFHLLDASVGTFDNRLSVSEADIASGAAWDTIVDHFNSINGPNGKPMGLSFDGGYAIVPSTMQTLFKNSLEFDTLIQSVNAAGAINPGSGAVAAVTRNNRYKGTFGYTIAYELANQDTFYAVARAKPGMKPWVIQTEGSPQQITFDKTSEYWKRTNKVAISYRGKMNSAAAFPHVIARVTVT